MRRNIFLVLALIVIVAAAIFAFVKKNDTAEQTVNPTPAPADNANSNPQDSGLIPDAKTYTSPTLGISFTYNPHPTATFEVTVTEQDSKIYVHGTQQKPEEGKTIEVFSKASGQTLAQAIKDRFLKSYSEKDCFVEAIDRTPGDPRPETYSYAEISYPAPADPDQPFFLNATKCPGVYSKTNAVQYFMANSAAPTKYVFMQLGQDSITDDGHPPKADGSKSDWADSVRIVQ